MYVDSSIFIDTFDYYCVLFSSLLFAHNCPYLLHQYTDLQNPLLQKYKFDAADFVKGSRDALIQVNMAIASVNFSNYSNG